MEFDVCEHRMRLLIIKFGKLLRKERGLLEEKDVTLLYEWTAPLLNIKIIPLSSKDMNHLPAPHEMKDADGEFIIPRRDCPKCGKKDSVVFASICPKCKESEGGKYKSGWKCENEGCEYIEDKSEKPYLQELREMKIPLPKSGMKRELGIKTITDKGLE